MDRPTSKLYISKILVEPLYREYILKTILYMYSNLSDIKYHEKYPFMRFFKITVPNSYQTAKKVET
ncbi:UNVERIFIED_CONTAM: hypothetical protein NCL1_36518 [Trichonephila clavipes]